MIRFALPLFSFVLANAVFAADNGLITLQCDHSVKETVARFEEAVRSKESLGFIVFTEIDHAAAATRFCLTLRPRTVIAFGKANNGP